jgi:hypothetical protein
MRDKAEREEVGDAVEIGQSYFTTPEAHIFDDIQLVHRDVLTDRELM